MNIYQKFLNKLKNKKIKKVKIKDIVKIEYLVQEEDNVYKKQNMEGICISKKNNNISSTFTLKKISISNIKIIKTFSIFSPLIKKITILKNKSK